MGTKRQSWPNPVGKWISLICIGLAIPFGVVAIISAAGVFDWTIEDGEAISHWWGTSIFAALSVVPGWFAFRTTWSITVGTRGIGIRKLWRNRFIRYDEFESAKVEPDSDPPRIRIVTKKGSLRVFPDIAGAEDLARHLASMKKSHG